MLLVKLRPASGFELTRAAYDLGALPLRHLDFKNVRLETAFVITIRRIRRKIVLYNG